MGDLATSAAGTTYTGTYTAISPTTGVNLLGDSVLTITGTMFPHNLDVDLISIGLAATADVATGRVAETVTCTPLTSTNT